MIKHISGGDKVNVCSVGGCSWGGTGGLRVKGGAKEQQLALSRGPGEGAGEEVSIALLLQLLPDTTHGGARGRSHDDQKAPRAVM